MNQLAPVWAWLIGSNLWLAAGASMMSSATTFRKTGHWQWGLVEAWVFFATMSLYNVHRLLNPHSLGVPHEIKPKVYLNWQSVLFYCASAMSVYLYFLFSKSLQLSLLIPCLLGLSYSLPFLPGRKSLRDVPRLKSLLLASVWAWVVVFLPLMYLKVPFDWFSLVVYFEKWLFFFAIAIAFDIRDIDFDTLNGTITIPVKFGVTKAKTIAILGLALAMGLCGLSFGLQQYSKATTGGLLLSLLFTGLLVAIATPRHSNRFYGGLLDGLLLFQPACIWALNALCSSTY